MFFYCTEWSHEWPAVSYRATCTRTVLRESTYSLPERKNTVQKIQFTCCIANVVGKGQLAWCREYL